MVEGYLRTVWKTKGGRTRALRRGGSFRHDRNHLAVGRNGEPLQRIREVYANDGTIGHLVQELLVPALRDDADLTFNGIPKQVRDDRYVPDDNNNKVKAPLVRVLDIIKERLLTLQRFLSNFYQTLLTATHQE